MGETRKELFNLRFQSATGALENSARLRSAKREIAIFFPDLPSE